MLASLKSRDPVRWSGLAAIVSGLALATGQIAFWLVVPDSDAERERERTLVFGTAVIWLVAHALMAPALVGIYSQVFRRLGVVGGSGAVLAVLGTTGICFYVFFLFPELVGFKPDSFHKAQVALALQAIGELGAASLVVGLLLLATSMIVTRAFAPLASGMLAAGALVAPFGLEDLAWLAVGACLVGLGLIVMGVLLVLGRAPAVRATWPRPDRRTQFRF